MSSGCVKRRGSVTTWMNSANTCGAIARTSPAESTCVSITRASVLGVLSYLRGHKEPGVEAMDHGRPSSISPSRSSSEVSGRSTEPRPTVAMSRTLCDREPSIRGAGATVPCASTVTSCPSGKRTPLSSTTTPFCTRPWETSSSRESLMQTHRILSRVAFERKVSCVSRSGTNRALEADHLAFCTKYRRWDLNPHGCYPTGF